MKTKLIMLSMAIVASFSTKAQINGYNAGSGNTQQYEHPLNSNGAVNQVPNYNQNNANFNNNATQTNKPSNANRPLFQGNAEYTDPTRSNNNGTLNNGVNTQYNMNSGGTLNNGVPGQKNNGIINTGTSPIKP